MDSCGGNPVAGASLEFWDEGREWNILHDEVKPFLVEEITTNSEGRFTINLTQGLVSGLGSVRHNDFKIMYGQVLGVESFEQDLGELFTMPFKRKVDYRFTRAGEFKRNDKIVLYQPHSAGVYRDTFVNLTGDKQGVLWFKGDAFYSTKLFYSIAEDSITHQVYTNFKHTDKNKNKPMFLHSEACDTAMQTIHVNF